MPSQLSINWNLGDRPDLGAMNVANGLLRSIDIKDPYFFPNFRGSHRLILGTDYGGQHASSRFEALSFVIADQRSIYSWVEATKEVRKSHLPNSRRMAFKSLNDKHRLKALPFFLAASDLLHGLIFVVLIDKRIDSLFEEEEVPLVTSDGKSIYHGSSKTFEKLLRVCHFSSLLVAGLSHESQDVLWITDQDDIAANLDMHRQMVSIFGNISSHYLEHTLGHLRVATTASDTHERTLEDFVALADLAAGSVCHVLNSYEEGIVPVKVVIPPPTDLPYKAQTLMDWFSNKRSSLKRLVLSFELQKNSTKLLIRQYQFAGSNDPV